MAIIPTSDWRPDEADLGMKGSPYVKNVLPGTNSFKPFPSFSQLFTALDSRPRGAIDVRDRSSNVFQYCGTADKLYQANGTGWTDVSKSGGYGTGTEEVWRFLVWKNQVIATNYSNTIQTITIGASNFADLTTDFRTRNLFVINDFIVAANTFDATDGEVGDRVRTCQFNDETSWTVDANLGAILRDIKSGPIIKTFGGEYGVLFSKTDTYRMDFTGAPTWFQINQTLPGVGVIGQGAAARIGDVIYAWSNQGFVAINSATGFVGIGAGRVDRFAFDDLDDSYLDRISTVADPRSGKIFWSYPGSGSDNGEPNRILCYDKNFDKWSTIEDEVSLLWAAGGVGLTLEQLDSVAASVDDLSASLDSSQWKGEGEILLAGFDSSFQHGFYSGSPMTAEVDTMEMELTSERRTMLQAFRPLVDGGDTTACVGYRDNLSDEIMLTPEYTRTSTGRVTCRVNARYHRFRVKASGEWTDILGVDLSKRDLRTVGWRG